MLQEQIYVGTVSVEALAGDSLKINKKLKKKSNSVGNIQVRHEVKVYVDFSVPFMRHVLNYCWCVHAVWEDDQRKSLQDKAKKPSVIEKE